MKTFIESADSRQTSTKIMEAIFYVSGRSESKSIRIWENPTIAEAIAIWERATNNGLHPSTDYHWGASGSNWATDTGAQPC